MSKKLENLMAISGMPGIYRMKANRSNGLIVEDLDNQKTQFVPMRKHQFTPLESVAIFTVTDSVELTGVFDRMAELESSTPPVDVKSSNEKLHEYFGQVLPDYDKERVYPNDIRKVIKWYSFLKEKQFFEGSGEEE